MEEINDAAEESSFDRISNEVNYYDVVYLQYGHDSVCIRLQVYRSYMQELLPNTQPM